MSSSITIRCTGRVTPRLLPGSQPIRLRPRQLVAPRSFRLKTTPYVSQFQHFSHLPPRQSQQAQTTSPPPPPPPPTGGPQQQQGRPGNWRPWVLFNLAGLAGAFLVAAVLKSKSAQDGAMNMSSFSPFTITSKEQVSPTAFVLSVRADQGGSGGSGGKDSSSSSSSSSPSLLLQRSWDHGLWSVEVKQPQLQIARHYTPLPPLAEGGEKKDAVAGGNRSGEGEVHGGGDELRFLIRKVDGGEMSTYLSKLQVGEKVWLRGPHLGFDIERRLGDVGRHVVFLAGGTGIAPALQVARKVLDGHSSGGETASEKEGEKPTVSILWANRYAADALGRQQEHLRGSGAGKGSSWFSRSVAPAPSDATGEQQQPQTPTESTLAHQIRELQAKHPDHFRISYFVDEERRFIEERDLRLALTDSSPTSTSTSTTTTTTATTPSTLCTWHSPTQLVILPDDNDLGRFAMPCACVKDGNTTKNNNKLSVQPGAGADLICVSGPDGFVAAYAGPKRWFGGTERQGPVRGVLEQVLQDGKVKAGEGEGGRNWLVLKL